MQQQLHKFAGKFTLAACCLALFFSCRKDKLSTDGNGNGGGGNGNGNGTTALSAEDSLKYLMYNIMQVSYADGGRNKAQGLPTYFWYSVVPVINPLDSKYSSADVLLSTMAQYAINPTTKRPYDHYSFLDRTGSLTNKLLNGVSAATTVAATSGDVGLDYGAAWDATNQKVRFFVLYADKNSPAGKVGVTRGYEIISINGNNKFDTTTTFLNQAYNAILNSSNVTVGFQRPDGSTFTANLAAGTYNVNPVAFDSVLTMGAKKVGYFVLYTYSSVTNSSGDPTNTKTAIDEAFTKFKAAGINNLIVDLRYNGGGAVSTAEYLDNLIAPAAAKGKLMYNYQYNDKLQAVAKTIELETEVNFSTADPGGLALENVFFITSRNTASASELTLNNLRPYMTVQLVGDTTYGKPVGFIDFNISMYDSTGKKKYLADLYAINFATTNASGSGGYYTGIAPQARARDLINIPWGNIVYDEHLNMINNYLKGNGYKITQTARTETVMPALSAISSATKMTGFNGMVDYRLSNKIQQALK